MNVEFLEKNYFINDARATPEPEQQQNTPASSWVSKDDADAQS